MVSPIVTVEGRSGLMASLLNGLIGGANACKIALFGNNYYPSSMSVLSDFAILGSPVVDELDLPPFTDAGVNSSLIDVWNSSPLTFTAGGGGAGTVAYGYLVYFVNPVSMLAQSLWTERFPAPYLFPAVGSTLTFSLTPGFTQG